MIKLRRFSLPDLDQLMEIEKSSFPQKITYSRPHFKRLYKKYPDGFYVACLSDKIVGYIAGHISNNSGNIDSVAIGPNYRLQGIGKKLINFLFEHFKERGVKTVSLHVRTNNESGVSFYKEFGFRILKAIKKYYSNGDDAFLTKASSQQGL